jgi:hypothetical protein
MGRETTHRVHVPLARGTLIYECKYVETKSDMEISGKAYTRDCLYETTFSRRLIADNGDSGKINVFLGSLGSFR